MVSPSVLRPTQERTVRAGRTGRLGEVQGLRALAVLLVVAYHSGLPVPGGFVGVDVFFVISGFVITRLLVAEVARTGRVDLVQFYRRRVRRLAPVAAVVLSVTLVGSALLQSPVGAQESTALTAIGASSWSANGFLFVLTHGYFGVNLHAVPLLHTWSLSVEEQFYLVFPVVLALCAVVARRRRRSFVRIAVVVGGAGLVVSFLANLWLMFADTGLPASAGLGYFSPVSRAWEFAAGALLCFVPGAWRPGRVATTLLSAAGVVLVAGGAFLIDATDAFPGYLALVPVLGTVLLLAAVDRGATTPVSRLLAAAPAQRLGDLSYGWYLWHWPLIVFVQVLWPGRVVAMLAASVVALWLATLTFRLVEQPFRASPGDAPRSTRRLVLVCVGVPVLLAVGLLVGSRSAWGNDGVRQLSAEVAPKPLNSESCLSDVPLAERSWAPCTFGSAGAGKPVVLVGDSNAAQYTDGMVEAAEKVGRPLRVATMQGCPLVDVVGRLDGSTIDRCHDAYRQSMAWLRDQPRSMVVVAAAGVWVDMDGVRLVDPATGRVADRPAAKGRLWQAGLERTYRSIRAMGHEVVHVSSVPFFASGPDRTWEASTCSLLTTVRDPAACGESMTRAQADAMQRHVLAAEEAAVRATGVRALDLRSAVCRDGRCATNVGDTWIYRDGMHLAVAESLRLSPLFEDLLRSSASPAKGPAAPARGDAPGDEVPGRSEGRPEGGRATPDGPAVPRTPRPASPVPPTTAPDERPAVPDPGREDLPPVPRPGDVLPLPELPGVAD